MLETEDNRQNITTKHALITQEIPRMLGAVSQEPWTKIIYIYVCVCVCVCVYTHSCCSSELLKMYFLNLHIIL